MAFLTGQSWRVFKSLYTSGTQNKDFDAVSQTDSTKSLVPSVLQATLLRLLLMAIALIAE